MEPEEPFTYVRRIPPSQNCQAEEMITIEPISLRRGGWRKTEGALNNIRHMDPKFGTVVFFGVVTAVMFFLYWKKYNSITASALYTTSSLTLLAVALSASLGIDFLSAVGANIF
jgi:cbb3-type cytochrome oxidase subunit 3